MLLGVIIFNNYARNTGFHGENLIAIKSRTAVFHGSFKSPTAVGLYRTTSPRTYARRCVSETLDNEVSQKFNNPRNSV